MHSVQSCALFLGGSGGMPPGKILKLGTLKLNLWHILQMHTVMFISHDYVIVPKH